MIFLCICLCFSIATNVAFALLLHCEHERICDRLMSRDIAEFKAITAETSNAVPAESAHEKAIKAWRNKGKSGD